MTEIEALRAEVKSLRDEVARLRGSLTSAPPLSPVYYYQPINPTAPHPLYPGGPIPATC